MKELPYCNEPEEVRDALLKQRREIEDVLEFDDLRNAMPYFEFPEGVQVAPMPTYGSSAAGFRVRRGNSCVSVLLVDDYLGGSGYMWDVWPSAECDGDKELFSVGYEKEVIDAVMESLKAQDLGILEPWFKDAPNK
jgi:hypothetical protein